MINNINTYNGNYNFNSPVSTGIDEIIEAHNKLKTTTDQTTVNPSDNLFLSSRAKKINALSTEFFSNGAMSFTDVNALKERAYGLGLISKQDYAQLTDTTLPEEGSELTVEMGCRSISDNIINKLRDRRIK
jgi:hypothetical protein